MKIKNNPLVSIVLITYNSEKYVLDTLESVKSQTWENIELIISDDGSRDSTVEICDRWLKENQHRFYNSRLITVKKNTGIPANCNRGLRAAQGDWLKTISADDILLNNCISDNLDYVAANQNASFLISDLNEIDENGNLIRNQVINEGLNFISSFSSVKKQLKYFSRWPVFLNVPTFFCKRELIEKVEYCDESFQIYEDTTMVIRIMELGYKLHYMKKTTVAYRIHSESISRSMKVDNRREKEALKVFTKYRIKHLNLLNPLDLSVYYESWLRFKYKGIFGVKGDTVLRKLSLFYWYMRFNGVKSY